MIDIEYQSNTVSVFLGGIGGRIDAIIRANTRKDFLFAALDTKLQFLEEVSETSNTEWNYDTSISFTGIELNSLSTVQESNTFYQEDKTYYTTTRNGRGVDIDEIGSIVLMPSEYDENGNVISEAITDDRYHVNIRLSGFALERINEDTGNPQWKDMAVLWTLNGEIDNEKNANEVGKKLYNVTLIDPDTISTRKRIFL